MLLFPVNYLLFPDTEVFLVLLVHSFLFMLLKRFLRENKLFFIVFQ